MIPVAGIHKKKIQIYSILIMTCIALVVAVSGFVYLYKLEVDKSRIALQQMAESQARIYEAVAKFDAIVSGSPEGKISRAGTMSQIKEAHTRYRGFGKTGELELAERVGDEVVFLLPTRKMDFEMPPPVPWDSDFAGPMKLALSGNSGTVKAIDHSGTMVLAAYEYLPFLEMGLVAKMDITELRQPFLRAALYTSIVAWLAIFVGALLNIRIVGPLVNTIFSTNKKLIESEERQRNVANQLSKYLSPQLYESIFAGTKTAQIESHRRKLTVFFSDMVGFTEKTDSMEAEDLSYHLNGYLNRMAEVVLAHGGTLDKFIGDAVLVFFGDPETLGAKEDAERCITMALAMREAIEDLKIEWKQEGIDPDFSVRMGIATGYCTVGNFGSENRMEYTIIGNSVNLASRLESAAQPGEILISYDTGTLVDETFLLEAVEEIHAKGFARGVKAYRVLGYRKTEASEAILQYAEPGFELNLDLNEVPDGEQQELVEKLHKAISLVKDKNSMN